MIDYGKQNILGVSVDAVDYEAAVARIITAAKARQGFSAAALAVHGVMTGVLDPVHRFRLNHLDLITPDGQPVRWAMQWLHGVRLPDRVYGPTLMLKVCEKAASEGIPVYLFGSNVPVIDELMAQLHKRFPQLILAGAEPSRFRRGTALEKQEVIRSIRDSGAAITFVGLGCPRQEVWIYEFVKELSMPLIAVGAAFDFHAGSLPQAPAGMQRWGLEWLYRLIKEPGRLWKRYLALSPLYLWNVALQKSGLRRYDTNEGQQPSEELTYI